jgi:hypothetical protein
MVSVIDAPTRIGGREQAQELLEGLRADLRGHRLEVVFANGVVYSTSFVDELVYEVLAERRADELIMRGLNDRACRVAVEAAESHDCSLRLTCID